MQSRKLSYPWYLIKLDKKGALFPISDPSKIHFKRRVHANVIIDLRVQFDFSFKVRSSSNATFVAPIERRKLCSHNGHILGQRRTLFNSGTNDRSLPLAVVDPRRASRQPDEAI